MEVYYCGWPSFTCHIQFEVGMGSTIRFWQDIWCGDTLLKLCYLELCARSHNKEAYVADLMKFPNGVLYWNLNFVRAFSLGVLNAKFLAFGTPKNLPRHMF